MLFVATIMLFVAYISLFALFSHCDFSIKVRTAQMQKSERRMNISVFSYRLANLFGESCEAIFSMVRSFKRPTLTQCMHATCYYNFEQANVRTHGRTDGRTQIRRVVLYVLACSLNTSVLRTDDAQRRLSPNSLQLKCLCVQ